MTERGASRFIVVAGTDTGVGKTVVTAGLARAIQRKGVRVIAVKPIETGCDDATRDEEDGATLAAATGQERPRHALVRLRSPVAPAVAADRARTAIDFDALVSDVRALADSAEVVLVEGAGGLLSPLTWERDLTHMIHALDASVVVVGADRLGTLNHVQVTVATMFANWLTPRAIVLCAPQMPDASTGSNPDALRRCLVHHHLEHRIAELPRVRDVDDAADRLGGMADWLL